LKIRIPQVLLVVAALTVSGAVAAPAVATETPRLNEAQLREALTTLKGHHASDARIEAELGLVHVSIPTTAAMPLDHNDNVTVTKPQLYYFPGRYDAGQPPVWIASSTYRWNNEDWGGTKWSTPPFWPWEDPPPDEGSPGIDDRRVDDIGGPDRFGMLLSEQVIPRGASAMFCSTEGACRTVTNLANPDFGTGASFRIQDRELDECTETVLFGIWCWRTGYTADTGVVAYSFDWLSPGCHMFAATYAHTWNETEITSWGPSAGYPLAVGISVSYSNVSEGDDWSSPTTLRACVARTAGNQWIVTGGDGVSASPPRVMPGGGGSSPPAPPSGLAVKRNDYNRNSVSDVVGIRTSDGCLAEWSGNGNGGMDYIGDIGCGWDSYTELTAVGDINRDSVGDLVAIRKSDGCIARWTGTGTGGFAYIGDYGCGWNSYAELTGAGDINRDGVADLVAVRKSDGCIARWMGNGNGGLDYAGDYGCGWNSYAELTGVGDLNRDGIGDLVAVRKSDGKLARWFGTGTGGFNYAGDYGGGWGSYANLAGMGDLNRDGVGDLVGIRKSDGCIARWTGNGNGGLDYAGDYGCGWSSYTIA